MVSFRCIARLLGLFMFALAGPVPAQPVAGATVKVLVGFPAGGGPDAVARVLAEHLQRATGATVIVDNRPGASGKIAIDALLSGAADGETVALIPASVLALLPHVAKAAKYDMVRDFAALGSVAEHGFAVGASMASPVTRIEGLKEWASAHPQRSYYATPGQGTPQHFLGAHLQKLLGIELTHVPYKGVVAALGDVVGGQVPLLISTEQFLTPYANDGKLKVLLVTSRQRNPKLPNAPTAREAGLPELEATDWFGLFAKAGTPPAKLAQWRDPVMKVIASSRFQEAMNNLGYAVPGMQPEDFPKLLAAERAAWSERVKVSGFAAAD